MMNYVELIQSPTILRVTALSLVVLFAIVLLLLVARQRRCLNELKSMSDSLSHLHESFVRTNLNLESTANRLQTIEAQSTELLENYQHSSERHKSW